jgi:uncharacterized coiled-coil protein SlyX
MPRMPRMPADPIADQAAGTAACCTLAALASPALDPLFRPQARSGIASAWHAHVPFAQWLVTATRPALIVELGTHNGISYAAFCETVLHEKLATRCYAVDSWAGDEHAGHYDENIYAELRDFHDGRYSAFSELLRMTFDEARGVIADGTIDLLHIDGFHSYEAVRHDFEGWAPKLSPRAVVLFHDINVLERGFGVARFWAEIEGRFPSFAFLHGHGLGVLAVGAAIPPAIGRLCGTTAPSAVALLRERFAALGRTHMLDYARREMARDEQRLRREAAERDTVTASLRRSLDEMAQDRDQVQIARESAERRLPAQESTIAALRQALAEAQGHAARWEAEALERQRQRETAATEGRQRLEDGDLTIAALQTKAKELAATTADQTAGLARLRAEIEAMRGNLAAARADAKAARMDGRTEAARLQSEIDRRDGELATLRSAHDGPVLAVPARAVGPGGPRDPAPGPALKGAASPRAAALPPILREDFVSALRKRASNATVWP